MPARLVLDRPPQEGYGRGAWGAAGQGDVHHVAEPQDGQREGDMSEGRSDVGQRDSEIRHNVLVCLRKR